MVRRCPRSHRLMQRISWGSRVIRICFRRGRHPHPRPGATRRIRRDRNSPPHNCSFPRRCACRCIADAAPAWGGPLPAALACKTWAPPMSRVAFRQIAACHPAGCPRRINLRPAIVLLSNRDAVAKGEAETTFADVRAALRQFREFDETNRICEEEETVPGSLTALSNAVVSSPPVPPLYFPIANKIIRMRASRPHPPGSCFAGALPRLGTKKTRRDHDAP